MSTLAQAILPPGLYADRPTDNSVLTAGRLYFGTDTNTTYRDTGATWEALPIVPEIPAGTYLAAVATDASLTGDGTPGNPLALVPDTATYLETVAVGASLTGDGTPGNPLAIAEITGGGHTIISSVETLPQRANLKIVGATVTDDSANDATLVTITGGGESGVSGSGMTTILPLMYTAKSGNWIMASADGYLPRYYSSNVVNDYLEYVTYLSNGTYTFTFHTPKNNDGGIATVYIDGVSIGTVDLYNSSLIWSVNTPITGITIAESGVKIIRIQITGKNPSANNYYFYWHWLQIHMTTAGTGGSTGGSSYGQTHNYPATFSGDVIDGSNIARFVDVVAFDTKEVLNERIMHLVTKGPNKDQKVRITLNTTKAGAFDVTVCVALNHVVWSTNGDTYADIVLKTAAGAAQICGIRTASVQTGSPYLAEMYSRPGGSSFPNIFTTTIDGKSLPGQGFTVRFVRDGSNAISFYYGQGTAPMALVSLCDNYGTPLAPVVTGTLACIEFAQHSTSGPPAGCIAEAFIDYIESV